MTPKEKAKHLIELFRPYSNKMCPIHDTNIKPEELEQEMFDEYETGYAKKCASAAVDEIIKALPFKSNIFNPEKPSPEFRYWQEIKAEIENP